MSYTVNKHDESRRARRIERAEARDERKRAKQCAQAKARHDREKAETDHRFRKDIHWVVKTARKRYVRGEYDLPILISVHIPSSLLTEKDAMKMASELLSQLVGEFGTPGIRYEYRPPGRWTYVSVSILRFNTT